VLDVDSAFIYTTPASCPGDSGSPLVDATGRLVGVASASASRDCERATSLFGRLDH
jgi:S1-C subfamily serine protease